MTRAGVSHGDGHSDVKRDGRCRPHRRRLARVGTQCVAFAWCRRSAGVPLPISLAVVSWLAKKSGTSPHERRFFRTVLKADTMAERALQVVASAVTGWCHRCSVAGARPEQGETGTSMDGRLKYRVQVGGVLAHGGTPSQRRPWPMVLPIGQKPAIADRGNPGDRANRDTPPGRAGF
jgi:hypothetical protein